MFGCEYTSAARWLKYNGVVVILIGLSFYSFKITLIKCVPPVTPVTAVTPVTPRVFISAQCRKICGKHYLDKNGIKDN